MHPTFAIVSPRGERIELSQTDSPFVLDDETTGLGMVSREVQITPSTGTGGRLRATRAASRPATLVVDVWGPSVAERDTNLATLLRVTRRVNGFPLPILEATLPDGTVYGLPFIRESGGEDLKRPGLGGPVAVPLGVIAPFPYWTARDAVPYEISGLNSTGTFLPQLAALHLTSSATLGDILITNDGDAEAHAVWQLTGPSTLVTVTLGSDKWTLGPISAGEVITVDTAARTAKTAAGADVYNRFGTAPRLFPLPPGDNAVRVTMAGATSVTTATCFFRPVKEVIL